MSKFKNTFASTRCEYNRTNKKCVLVIPIILLFLGIFTRWVSGSPISTLHFLEIRDTVPPSWLMVVLFSIFYIVSGLSLGTALGNKYCANGEKKYQGAMWFCISLALGYAWYPLFFCARLFLVSMILSLVCFATSLFATLCFINVSKISFFLSLFSNCWLLYLLFLNMQIFFAI